MSFKAACKISREVRIISFPAEWSLQELSYAVNRRAKSRSRERGL